MGIKLLLLQLPTIPVQMLPPYIIYKLQTIKAIKLKRNELLTFLILFFALSPNYYLVSCSFFVADKISIFLEQARQIYEDRTKCSIIRSQQFIEENQGTEFMNDPQPF